MAFPWKSRRIAKEDLKQATDGLWMMERHVADIRDQLQSIDVNVDQLLAQLSAIRVLLEGERSTARTAIVIAGVTLGAQLLQPVATVEYQRWRENDGVAHNPPPPAVVFDQSVTNITRIYATDESQVWQGTSVEPTVSPQPVRTTTGVPQPSVGTAEMTTQRHQASGDGVAIPGRSTSDWLDESTSVGQFFDGPETAERADESSE